MSSIGYNVGEINLILDTMNKSFSTVGETMASGWPNIVSTMQTHWVGIDEQDFENKLAKRLVELYTNCYNVVETSMQNIVYMQKSWEDMQNENHMDGETLTGITFGLEIPTVAGYDIAQTVKLNEVTFTTAMNMGLLDGTGSAVTILNTINSYIEEIKSKIDALFGNVDANKAFLDPENATQVSNYIAATGVALKNLDTDVDDLTQNLATLAGTNYENMVQSLNQAVTQGIDNMDSTWA